MLITVRTALSLAVTGFLAACGSHASSTGRPIVAAARPVSCRQQYETWQHGPAEAELSKLAPTLHTVQVAAKAGDVPGIAAAAQGLKPAALVLAGDPVPHCADPAGLYAQYVNRIYTAGSDARTAKGLSGLLTATAPLKGLKTMESRLAAEANRALAKS